MDSFYSTLGNYLVSNIFVAKLLITAFMVGTSFLFFYPPDISHLSHVENQPKAYPLFAHHSSRLVLFSSVSNNLSNVCIRNSQNQRHFLRRIFPFVDLWHLDFFHALYLSSTNVALLSKVKDPKKACSIFAHALLCFSVFLLHVCVFCFIHESHPNLIQKNLLQYQKD